ncbi:MAG: hypothetical protein HY459_04830 [Parcubacteria group bacterium]|nr:hypothetical protein [Parcubacteria group bacterium]
MRKAKPMLQKKPVKSLIALLAIYTIGALLLTLYFVGVIPKQMDDVAGFLFLFFLLFASIASMALRKAVLQKINELVLLAFAVAFWFLFLTHIEGMYKPLFALIAFIPTLAIVMNVLLDKQLTFPWRVFFYALFLAMDLFLLYFQFSASSSTFFNPTASTLGLFDLVNAFFLGIVSFYLIANVWYLFILLPLPDRHRPYQEVLRDWRAHLHLLAGKYSNRQSKFSYAVMMIVGGVLLSGNHLARLLPDILMVNLWLIVTGKFFLTETSTPTRDHTPIEVQPL